MANRQKVIQNAEKLVARGRIQAAIDEYRKVLDRHPNDTSTLNRVGDLYARLNRMPKAIELFQQTAESFGRQGFFVKAIAIYKKIIRLDPGQIRAYENLADLYNRQGLTNDSLAQYQVVADYYEKHQDLESAIDVNFNMVSIEPTNPSRRLQLAGMLDRVGRKTQALDQYYEIASLMLQHSRGEDALRVLSEALELESGDLDFIRKAVLALKEAGFDSLSSDMLEAAAALNPQANALRVELLSSEAGSTPTPVLDPPPPAEVDEPVVEEAVEESPSADTVILDDESSAETLIAEVEVEAEEEPGLEEEPALEEEPGLEEEVAEAAADDATPETEDLEFDLSEIAGMASAGGIDPPVELAPAAEAEATDEGEDAGGDVVLDLDEAEEASFELDDDDATEAAADAAAEVETDEEAVETGEAEAGIELELGDEEPESLAPLESVAAAAPESSGETIKLLIESEVLSRYGMDVMAITVLEKILKAEPEESEALARIVRLQLKLDRTDEALVGANQLADIVARQGEPTSWVPLCDELAEQGFTLEDGRFVAPAVSASEPEEPEAEEPEAPEAAAEVEVAGSEPEDPASIETLIKEVESEEKKSRRRPQATQDVLAEVIEEIERDEGEPVERSEDDLWLEQLPPAEKEKESEKAVEPPVAEAPAEPPAAAVDEGFVDLATELEAELAGVGDLEDDLAPGMREQSLEDIVEGFRQGMAETLSEEDFDTHYNLGVAYSEMGLTDEAIGEFQLAAKDPRYLVQSCSLLASCFVDKGFSDLAVQAYETGLESPTLEEEQRLGLLYELGTLLVATGEQEAARERFVELYGISSNYRDVVARLEELKE